MSMTAATLMFTDATKVGAWARVALTGPTGSGKTYTALTLAQTFGGVVGLVDTDRVSASKYAHLFKFRSLPMAAYDPADLTLVVAAAADQGIDTLIIDTWSPFWSGLDGMLERVDRATVAAGSRDKFGSGWNAMKPVERAMLDAMFGFPGHLIVTVKSKVEYVVDRDPNTGKIGPRRVGLKPDQRDGFESDFDVAGTLDAGTLVVTKSRCPALTDAVVHHPGGDFAAAVLAWLDEAAVGDPFNPLTVRDWVLDPDRTLDELRARFEQLAVTGQIGAVVLDGDEPLTLERLFRRRRAELLPTTTAAASSLEVPA